MASPEQSIEVEVPIQTAYGQWTQLEELPSFMDSGAWRGDVPRS